MFLLFGRQECGWTPGVIITSFCSPREMVTYFFNPEGFPYLLCFWRPANRWVQMFSYIVYKNYELSVFSLSDIKSGKTVQSQNNKLIFPLNLVQFLFNLHIFFVSFVLFHHRQHTDPAVPWSSWCCLISNGVQLPAEPKHPGRTRTECSL